MSIRTGKWDLRAGVVLLMVALSLLLPASALAQEANNVAINEQRATFPVLEPPEAPFSAHQSMLRFAPGAGAPLHRHGGPGYITILEGGVTLYENGEEHVYSAGESFIETPDNEYWAVNVADQDMILMVTYLIPQGADVTTNIEGPDTPQAPDVGPEIVAERVQEFPDPPDSFELIHTVRSYDPGSSTEAATTDGALLKTVVGGALTANVEGDPHPLEAGDAVYISAGQEYVFTNESGSQAVTMSTEFSPDAYSMVPHAGSTVDRTMAIWLFIMTATGVLIVGGILRLGVVGPRTR